ncbi:ABC transporter substrate-binding protein [Rhizobium sp. RAF36]|uniref:ABC transporter substrate-binding protein n=1 Tax=Rhizobium sp. RAF36 TaxID=3233055 RepID=UPI003F94E3D0
MSAASVAIGLTAAQAQTLPDYYPSSYSQIVEGSKAEGSLLVQSNVGQPNWKPILEAFAKEYPWIKVQTLDLSGTEVFERYYAEQAAGSSEADIILAASGAAWADFIAKGNVVPYESPEASKVPDWSKPVPGVYTISVDPSVIVYNKRVLKESEYPTSISDLAKLVQANPGKFTKRLATIEPFGSSAKESQETHYLHHVGLDKALANFSILGPVADLQRSGGPVFEKILTGEYVAGWDLSAVQLVPFLRDPARASIIGFALPKDGLVMSTRYYSIAKTTKHPNAAKLLVDFIISKKGQEAVSAGGLIPYRSGLDIPTGVYDFTYDKIVKEVGEQNIVQTSLDKNLITAPPEYLENMRPSGSRRSNSGTARIASPIWGPAPPGLLFEGMRT